jgi:beta-N-acetylhexosaminidase
MRPRALPALGAACAACLAALGGLDATAATHASNASRAAIGVARPSPYSTRTPTGARAVAPRAPLVSRLSPAQLAGQRIVYAYPGLAPPRSLLALIRRGEAAGVILFAPNIGSRAQTRAAIAELQREARASAVRAPLLVMTDQEGGLVRRLPGAPALSERQIGDGPDAASRAAHAGRAAGRNLAGVGINVNLAPVLDVFRHPGDFIDSAQRSYGSNPGLVAKLGRAFIGAQQRTGVAATAKHFPGLGAAAASQDTDAGPVTLRVPLNELRSVDERPYRTAIAAGVRLVMTSWATYPALDPHSPAGLSAKVIEGELRRRLGFRGVTITDSLGAGALARYGSFARRGLLAARAGADLILCAARQLSGNRPAEGVAVLHGLTAALENGAISRTAAEAAARRVLALRLHPWPSSPQTSLLPRLSAERRTGLEPATFGLGSRRSTN